MPHLDQKGRYIIKIEGGVDATLVDWFGPIEITSVVADGAEVVTTLSGIIADQAGLVGLLRHLHNLGIVLLAVERQAPPSCG